MEARIKRLFSRPKFSSTPDLKGYSYDKAIPSVPPTRGSCPVSDRNGIAAVREQAARQSQISDSSATEPDTLERRQLDLNIPHSPVAAEDSKDSKSSSGRTFSGFSMKSPPSLRKKRRTTTSSIKTVETVQADADTYVPPLPHPVPQYLKHVRSRSSHVDIIQASSLKQHASGRRDYGEDVADRNIEEHSGPDFGPNFNFVSPEITHMRSIYLRQKGVANKQMSREHSCAGSAPERVLKDDQSSINDEPRCSLTPAPIVTRISSDGRSKSRTKGPLSPNHSLVDSLDSNSILVSTTRKTSVVSTYQPSGKPTPIYSTSYRPKPAVPPRSEARTLSMTSSYSRGRSRTAREPVRDDSSASKGWRTIDDFIIKRPAEGNNAAVQEAAQESSSPIDKSAVATAPMAVTGKDNTRSRASFEASTTWPLVAPRSISKNHPEPRTEKKPTTAPPVTPPMSPNNHLHIISPQKHNRSPTKSPTKSPAKSPSAVRSRANSATYSPFPKTGISPRSVSRQAIQMPNDTHESTLNSSSSSAQVRPGLKFNRAVEAPSLGGAVDANDSVDTKVSKNTLPAVTNETIVPQVRNIREEQVTRELHTHDVFHRIQPVLDVEVLPTKHYALNSSGLLTEIPPSTSRPDDESIEGSLATSTASSDSYSDSDSDSAAPPAIKSNRTHRTSVSTLPNPDSFTDHSIFTSIRANSMLSNLPRLSTTWRRPSASETVQQNKLATHKPASSKSPAISSYDGAADRYDDFGSESSQSRRSEDSGLLFRDTGYGGGFSAYGGGMLPGLMEPSPVANPVVEESEATKALRRRREVEKLKRRLGNLG